MIFRSPHPDVQIPNSALAPFVLRHAERLADKIALIDGTTGHSLTYSELATAVERTAVGLKEHGLGKGDTLAIYAPNCIEYGIACYAVSWLGGIVTTLNPAYTEAELTYQLNDSDAGFLLTTPGLMEKAGPAAQMVGIRKLFIFGEAPGAISFAELSNSERHCPPTAVDPVNDVAALPYSSGTTGLPKGVMLTHRNMVGNLMQMSPAQAISEADVVLCVVPLFHVMGLQCLLNSGLANGCTVVLLPRFEIETFLGAIERYGVTFSAVSPPTILILSKHEAVDRYRLNSLRRLMVGAAPLGEGLGQTCADRLRCAVEQGYGLTEASPVTHMTIVGQNKPGHIGTLSANTEAMIVDPETGIDLGTDEAGELWIRGPQTMKGYHNRPEESAATVDADGWLHTGDVAVVDEEGSFAIVDRLKELIKYKGYQVAPAELEALLLTHPAVADVAVVRSPDESAGEVPKAFVVLSGPATADELMTFVAERVAPFKKIRRMEFVDTIPKSPSGKILRRTLVEQERLALAINV